MSRSILSCSRKPNLLHILHFISCVLLYFPTGFIWFVGNLLVYLNSFVYARNGSTSFQTPWLISVHNTFWCISMILGGYLIRKLNTTIVQLIGVLLLDAGFFLSTLTVEYDLFTLLLTLGVLTGVGEGFTQTEIFERFTKVMKETAGTYMAMLATAVGVAGMVYNVIITWYLNPKNLKADKAVDNAQLFTDKSIIERVPSLFILLGTISIVLHFIGLCMTLCLIYTHRANKTSKYSDNNDKSGPFENGSNPTRDGLSTTNTSNKDSSQRVDLTKGASETSNLLSSPNSSQNQKAKHTRDFPTPDERSMDDSVRSHKAGDCSEGNSSSSVDLSSRQMLKTRHFYVIWFGKFICDAMEVVINNSYKEFGQLWIHDDHFLTNLGNGAIATVCVSRLLLCFVVEKANVKNMQILLTSVSSLCCLFFYFAPQINRWFYLVLTCLSLSVNAVAHTYIQVMVLKFFGKTHFGLNYGIVLTSSVMLYIVAPLTFKAVLELIGWSAIFIGTGAASLVILIVSILFLPSRI